MKIIKPVKISLFFCIFFIAGLYCYGQGTVDFYNKQRTYSELKQSLLNSVDLVSQYDNVQLHNIKISISNYFYVSDFNAALDSLKKYDRERNFYHYYILMYYSMGEVTVNKMIIRGYARNNCGREVVYYLNPPDFDNMSTNKYVYKYSVFNEVYNKMNVLDNSPPNSLLFISLFKKGYFETKIFKANDLSPEDFKKIEALLGDNR